MNSYEIQYAVLGHLAGVLTFQLFAFDRDSLVETGKCPTPTETKAYSAYQIMADDMAISASLLVGFLASWFMVSSRLLKKRNRSAFDIVSFTQHLILAATFLRNMSTFSDINKAGPFPSEIFQCKTVMMFAMSHLGQLCIQTLTMVLLNHFAYDETQKNVNKDRKRALGLFSATYSLAGFISGYYWIFSVMFDRLAFAQPVIDLMNIVRLQHAYSTALTAPPVFMLAAPFALMSNMLLTMFRWSIWRSRIEVAAFGVCLMIGAAMVFDYVVLSHETLAVEVSDIHTSDELLGFFRITGFAHALIAFVLCPALCMIVSRSKHLNEPRLHEIRYVRKEMKPPTASIPSEARDAKAVKAA